jgi:hypothetical protein
MVKNLQRPGAAMENTQALDCNLSFERARKTLLREQLL